ncbi:helix-turn-helix domain-containing protein [Paenibacillus sp. S-38]|uniref:helix-turn-helix domain-containing protein n=1 Tax=Paenibacillus sp. S-38 TaxID=3416710 RepID=UPI003CE98C8B
MSELRSEKKLSQDELATRLKISKSAVGMYERDQREPSFELVREIADYFDVSTDYLLGRTDLRKEDPLLDPRLNIHFKDWDKLSHEDQEEVKAFLRAKLLIRQEKERGN